MKTLHSFFVLICFVPVIVFSQGVGVGTVAPDASAALDVTSTTKGILVPRMSTAQRTAISSPVNGLLVFDLTTNSFWFKGNGPWIELIDTSNTVVHKMGTDIYMGMGGNVGIGTTTPTSKLEVKTSPGLPGIRHTDGVVTMQTNTTASAATIGTTTNHSLQLFANNGINQFTISPTGFVGIGTASPQQQLHVNGNSFLQGFLGIGMASPEAPLHFSSTNGDKIALYGNSGSFYGFGMAANMMQMYTPNSSGAIGFGYGSSAAFTENMRITGDGKVGIGTNAPSERLSVNGNGNFSGSLTLGGALAVGLGVAVGGGLAVGGGAGFGGAVSVGAPTPNASAQLDVSSTTKGLLMPRMTTSQQNAIPSPAEGLTVYNTETHSPWYRTDDDWKELKEDSTANDEQFVFRNSPSEIYMGLTDGVGIGFSNPQNKLDIVSGFSRLGTHPTARPLYVTGVFSDASNGVEFRYYDGTEGIGFGKNTIYAAGSNTNQNIGLAAKGATGGIRLMTNGMDRMFVSGAGNIGIGTEVPNAPLQFANNVVNRKIVLFETTNNDNQYFGFGINGLAMRYQVDGPGSSHIFYAGSSSTTSNELMRITGQGYVGIGVALPQANLEVARGTGIDGTAMFKGTTHISYFNNNTEEDTYIRGGKDGSNVLINDVAGLGNVGIGTVVALQKLHVEGGVYVSGNEGIGTPTPLQKLHIEGNEYISGNEGVGISTPQNKVDIQTGSARTGTHPTGRPLYVTGDISSESNGIEFRHSNGSQGVGIGFNTVYATGNNPDQDLGLTSRGMGSLIFKTNQSEWMRINGNGNIGIGTSSPNAPLQFGNTVQNRKMVLYESANNDHQFYGLGINGFTLRYQVSGTTDNHIFYAGTSSSTSNELMRIQGNGNVGIGTSNPTDKLVVAGDEKVTGTLKIGYEVVQNSGIIPGFSYPGAVSCDCPPGMVVLGGGWLGFSLDVIGSEPQYGTAWLVTANNTLPDPHTLHVYAICARLGQ